MREWGCNTSGGRGGDARTSVADARAPEYVHLLLRAARRWATVRIARPPAKQCDARCSCGLNQAGKRACQ